MKDMNEKLNQLGAEMDPTGKVFDAEDRILRGIRAEFSEYYAALLHNPVVQGMNGQKIVGTSVEENGLEDYPLTLRHDRISPVSYCFEWPAVMLQDAALLTLDICLELLDQKIVLKDATPWNVLFDGSKPVFVDFTSIMPQDENLLWVAYDQFCRLFLFPMVVASKTSSKLSRSLLLSSLSGITDGDLMDILPGGSWLNYPWLIKRLYLPRMVVGMLQKTGQTQQAVKMSRGAQPTSGQRRKLFSDLQKDVNSLKFSLGQSRWSQYYADMQEFTELKATQAKQEKILEILDNCKPRTVTDVGSNLGGYAILAAKSGVERVIAFDTDEDSVSLLYQLAVKNNYPILPLVMDALNPSPQAGWRAAQFQSAPQRFQSEMALALALVHHLAITQMQTFDRIVQTLDDYTSRWLITEYVPLEDPRSIELLATNQRDMSWYTLENLLKALGAVYSRVETYPSYPEGRVLCFCEK
jgi:hypothetical protein